jgi:hypothetical protein
LLNRPLSRVRNRIETKRDASGEAVLAFARQRMELCTVGVAQETLKSGLAIEASAAGRLQCFSGWRQTSRTN